MGKRTVIVRQGLIYKKRTQVLSAGRHVPRYRGRGMGLVGEVGGKKTAHRYVRRRYKEEEPIRCFSDPFTVEDFTWAAYKFTIGEALLSYITGPTGPLDFAAAFDKPAGDPHPAIFRGGGMALYRIEDLDLPLCNYLVFKLDAINIIKDLTGWSKESKGTVSLSFDISSSDVAVHVTALPGLYYKDISSFRANKRKLNKVTISARMYTECIDYNAIHHEVNMTFDYIKMSNKIPEGGTEVWSQIPL